MAGYDSVRANGWQLAQGQSRPCAGCGRPGLLLYRGRRLVGRVWEDVPELLLCESCLEAHLRAQRRARDALPPPPWWRFWSRRPRRAPRR